MNKDAVKNLALVLLLGVVIFSMVRYVGELRARFILQDALTQSQSAVVVLAQEKQNLLQELEKEKELNEQLAANNVELKDYLKASTGRITRFFRSSSKTQHELEEISAKFAVLKAENRALIESHKRSYIENEQLKLKLSSVAELRKVIRELRAKRFKSPGFATGGNKGFLIKDYRSTLEKIRIEVVPAKTKE